MSNIYLMEIEYWKAMKFCCWGLGVGPPTQCLKHDKKKLPQEPVLVNLSTFSNSRQFIAVRTLSTLYATDGT